VKSILSDELVRQIIAVGQADLMVGVPSFNQATTIGQVTRAAHLAFSRWYVRERTLLVNADGGSTDGTPDVVGSASLQDEDSLVATQSLRTIHRISAPYHGVCGKGTALRNLFTAGDLLQARAIVVLDPEVTTVTPEWVRALADPVLKDGVDFVAPVYIRHPGEGPLVTQLARPLVQGVYGHRLLEPVGGEFACSPRFAAHALAMLPWEEDGLLDGIDPWLPLTALTGGFRCAQAVLGRRESSPTLRPGLAEVIQQVVGTLFSCAERHEAYWMAHETLDDVPVLGAPASPEGERPDFDLDFLTQSFRSGVTDLSPLLAQILPGPLATALAGAARTVGVPDLPDALWAQTVLAFLEADHRRQMPRAHLVQSLTPVYLGRAAMFLSRSDGVPADEVERELDDLCNTFHATRSQLVSRWNT